MSRPDGSHEASKVEKPSLLSSSAQGASFLILLQVLSRLLTFAVNQLLLRYLSPALLGISTQLELYQVSVLYFARESLRVAVQRQSDDAKDDGPGETKEGTRDGKASTGRRDGLAADSAAGKTQSVVNLSYVSVGLGFPFTLVLGALYLRSQSDQPEIQATPWLRQSVYLYGLAAVAELWTEPAFVVVQQKMLYRIRARAESSATVIRCLVTCGIAVVAARRGADIGVLPFALGQMSYAGVLLVLYYWPIIAVAKANGFSLLCQRIQSGTPSLYIWSFFSQPLLSVGMSLFAQSAIKHVLAQGDSLLIGALSSIQDQGVYALASNYGSLVARMLFQPIEESCRNLFARLLSHEPSSTTSQKAEQASLATACSILRDTLRLYLIFSIIATSLGPTVAPILLSLIAGPRWTGSGAGAVLATYCYYIPVLALNGVTESFIASVASPADLHAQSAWMLVFSTAFALAGYLFLRVLHWGAQGLVWANAATMLLRVIWSWRFIQTYIVRRTSSSSKSSPRLTLAEILPSAGSMAAGIGAAAVLRGLSNPVPGLRFTGRPVHDLVLAAGVAMPMGLVV